MLENKLYLYLNLDEQGEILDYDVAIVGQYEEKDFMKEMATIGQNYGRIDLSLMEKFKITPKKVKIK